MTEMSQYNCFVENSGNYEKFLALPGQPTGVIFSLFCGIAPTLVILARQITAQLHIPIRTIRDWVRGNTNGRVCDNRSVEILPRSQSNKNGQQLHNEGEELERIEESRAAARRDQADKLSRNDRGQFQPVGETFRQLDRVPRAHDIVAKAIGLGSGRQWDRLQEVAQKAPELLSEIKPHGLSIGGAYSQVKKQECRAKDGGNVSTI